MQLIKEIEEKCQSKSEAIQLIRVRMKELTGETMDSREAEIWLSQNLPLEKDYQKKIITRIRKLFPDAFVWKASAGPYSMGGIPDVCCVINGRFYGFEVKRPFFGRLSDLQRRMVDRIIAAGGLAYVVTSAEQVEELLAPELGK